MEMEGKAIVIDVPVSMMTGPNGDVNWDMIEKLSEKAKEMSRLCGLIVIMKLRDKENSIRKESSI
jgi:hypothetical protein